MYSQLFFTRTNRNWCFLFWRSTQTKLVFSTSGLHMHVFIVHLIVNQLFYYSYTCLITLICRTMLNIITKIRDYGKLWRIQVSSGVIVIDNNRKWPHRWARLARALRGYQMKLIYVEAIWVLHWISASFMK